MIRHPVRALVFFSVVTSAACSSPQQGPNAVAQEADPEADVAEPQVTPPTAAQIDKAKAQQASAIKAKSTAQANRDVTTPAAGVAAVAPKKAAPPAEGGPTVLPKKIARYFDKLGLALALPDGLKPAKVRQNPDMHYEFAVQRPGVFEVRYAAAPFPPEVPAEAVGFMTSMNIAESEEAILMSEELPADELQRDYKAEWGHLYLLKPRKSFAQDWQLCAMQVLRHGDVYAYTFMLFNDRNEDVQAAVDGMLSAMKFK